GSPRRHPTSGDRRMSPHKTIDRRALVRRHSPVLTAADPRSPLSIGNGELAFTADLTGFQSRPDSVAVPLCTMAQWGFHSYPELGDRAAAYKRLVLDKFDAGARSVGYMSRSLGQEELYN